MAAKKAGASSVRLSVLPFQRQTSFPSSVFIDDVMAHLRETASPETHPGLYRSPIPKDVGFLIVREKIELDGRKRPEGDNAPCPMCSTNKFLKCSLVYIESMECCAVIGHCCADKHARARAADEFRRRTQREFEENYLLNYLPIVGKRLDTLRGWMPAAKEAEKVFRQFRREAGLVQSALRQSRLNAGGQLMLTEVIKGQEDEEKSDYFGPAGFRGTKDIQTRDHSFGMLAGAVMTQKDYQPVKELETLIRQLGSIDTITDVDTLLDFIISQPPNKRKAAVVIMTEVDKGAAKFASRMEEFLSFFTEPNATALKAFGNSPHNPLGFDVEFGLTKTGPCMVFKLGRQRCVLQVGYHCSQFRFEWPS
jgi:hypothetical protein